MDNLKNTYCKKTEDNLRRYYSSGWTPIATLNEGDDFIVAKLCFSREVCYTVGKDSPLLNHFRLIEDAKPDVCYTKDIKDSFDYENISLDIVNEKQYSESRINSILEHILSLQVKYYGGNYINAEEIVKELNKFGFYPNPEGKRMDGN